MPIPAEQMSPVMKTSRFAWSPGRFDPTSFAIGTRSTLAMVWLMNVEITCGGTSARHQCPIVAGATRTKTTGDKTSTTV